MKQDEQVGSAIVINVDDGSDVFVGRRVEFFDQIDAIVEIPVRFAADERPVLVILLDVGSAVEVGVDANFGGLSLIVVLAPDVRPAVAIAILRTDM